VRTIWFAAALGCSLFCGLAGSSFSQESEQFESLLASAQRAQARGDFESAAEFYSKAVSLQPDIAELRANLGLMYYQTGKDEHAIDAFREAIRLKPGLFVPNLFLGLDYLKIKRFNEAIPYLERAALVKPTDLQAQLALGQAYAATGKTRLAIASYLRIVEVDAGNANGWFHLGVAYLDQVEADARLLLARHKDSGYLRALEADTFRDQNDLIQAAEAYKTTLASRSFPPGIHADYGFLLLYQHDFPAAEHELNAELASNPESLMSKLGLARLQVEQGEAKKGVNEIVAIWKTNASFLQANASVFTRGLPAPKIAELQRSLQEGRTAGEVPGEVVSLFQGDATGGSITGLPEPSSIAVDTPGRSSGKPVHTPHEDAECADLRAASLQQLQGIRRLASCAYSTGRFETAFGAAQKLIQNPATEAEGLYWDTRSSQKLAIGALARASAIDSNSPTLHVLLGDTYRQREYYPDAEQEYRKALAIQPEDTGALLGLSLALIADSQTDEALHLTEAALKKNPDDPEINALMGEVLSRQYDFTAAEPYLKKALLEKAQNTRPELAPHVHALLGRVYAETNRPQEAINELNIGLADDKDGHLYYQLARLYLKVGDRTSAKKALDASERLHSKGQTKATPAVQPSDAATE
jgi:tetratricopeptide (TPR) repeat protein